MNKIVITIAAFVVHRRKCEVCALCSLQLFVICRMIALFAEVGSALSESIAVPVQ